MIFTPPLAAQDLLPGELPVEFGREMVEPQRFPTVRELVERLAEPRQGAAIVFRFYGDQHNHYAPQWSADGRALALLRSDIEAHTAKIVILPALDAEKPVVLYPGSDSYDHMFAWATSGGRTFAFASTNEPSERENLHLASLVSEADGLKPRRVTSGPGVKTNPALWTEGTSGRLLFSLAGKLSSLELDLARQSDDGAGQPLGDGTEAAWSPDGQWLVWTERTSLSANVGNFALKLRDRSRGTDLRLFSQPGLMLRNPAWSPDGRHVAFYARPTQQPTWRLYAIPVGIGSARPRDRAAPPLAEDDDGGPAGPGKPFAVAQDVRVEEHFQNFGPSWDPRADRLWYFGKSDEQEYYPLRWASLSGRRGEVGYPRRLTTGLDVAVNPNPALRAIAFCAIEDLRQDVVVLILSHENEP